ncbi:MAG TPA: SGNH/GDSL hydrolase family protein [Thermoanaerobaculia bacterium]|nr:SGNH/GDSL hydrolase family protein [Thermoanaerobaculia bacterium]
MTRLAKSGLAAACVLGLSLLAAPRASAQADLTKFFVIGDSIMAGFTDGCWVKHGQIDSIGAVVARQAGVTYEQPLLDEPGVGGCLVLTSLAPTFTRKQSIPKPLNLTYPKPYNNLAVPGYNVKDVTDSKSSADNGNALTDLVLRGSGATVLQQAASQQPTFVMVFIGNNDVLGAGTSGTVIEGATLTPFSVIDPRMDQIVNTLKAAQGGTGKGIFLTLADITALPFFTTIPPYIIVGGKTITNPATGRPFTFLSQRVIKDHTIPTGELGPVAPIPEDSIVTLQAAGFLATGYGIPCAILDAGGVAASDPRRLHCNQPLPDDANRVAKTPGVILYSDESAAIRARTLQINNKITAAASAAGFKVVDLGALLADFVAHGREFGGITIGTSFLTGGFFSYDGVHPTSTGYAMVAGELIKFINANYGNSIEQPNMATFLFNGNSQAGGYPVGAALSSDERSAYAASIFSPENTRTPIYPSFGLGHVSIPVGNSAGPAPRERPSTHEGERSRD